MGQWTTPGSTVSWADGNESHLVHGVLEGRVVAHRDVGIHHPAIRRNRLEQSLLKTPLCAHFQEQFLPDYCLF